MAPIQKLSEPAWIHSFCSFAAKDAGEAQSSSLISLSLQVSLAAIILHSFSELAIMWNTIPPYATTIALLMASNVFMTFAWYAHLREMPTKHWLLAVLASWSIAFFEYLLQVPANRAGATVMSLGQLKILQEVIALTIFVPFAIFYMKQKLTLDYLWASLCIAAAAYFIFRK